MQNALTNPLIRLAVFCTALALCLCVGRASLLAAINPEPGHWAARLGWAGTVIVVTWLGGYTFALGSGTLIRTDGHLLTVPILDRLSTPTEITIGCILFALPLLLVVNLIRNSRIGAALGDHAHTLFWGLSAMIILASAALVRTALTETTRSIKAAIAKRAGR
jgi:hypothetical protein